MWDTATHIKPPRGWDWHFTSISRQVPWPCFGQAYDAYCSKNIIFLNPGQTTVIGADQPFFDIFGKKHYVMLMGALHIVDKGHLMLGKSSVSKDGCVQCQLLRCSYAVGIPNPRRSLHQTHMLCTPKCHWSLYHSSNRRFMGVTVERPVVIQSRLTCGRKIVPGAARCFSSWKRF